MSTENLNLTLLALKGYPTHVENGTSHICQDRNALELMINGNSSNMFTYNNSIIFQGFCNAGHKLKLAMSVVYFLILYLP